MKNKQITLPINISLAVGAYTTKIWVGSEQIKVNVIIDTGSSTLAINSDKYNPCKDQTLKTTSFAQSVVYGLGGWAGPVIHSQVELNHDQELILEDAPLALALDSQPNSFQQADGIWGLAYHHLNKSYDVSQYLNQQKPPLNSTYPWPFHNQISTTSVAAFKKYLRQFNEQDITPLFTAFEENKITTNQFALSTHRSIVYVPRDGLTQEEIANEQLNQGEFIIGAKVPDSPASSLKVVHDAYYNTELLSCQVDGFPSYTAPPLQSEKINNFFSNAIIDSGCSFLVLQKSIYTYVMDCLKQINKNFPHQVQKAQTAFKTDKSYLNPNIELNKWPDISLNFSGNNDEPVKLLIPPTCYWQQHAQKPGNWMFMLMNQLPQWPDQTICGLPLINNYYCVFDRSNTKNGMIHCFPKSKHH